MCNDGQLFAAVISCDLVAVQKCLQNKAVNINAMIASKEKPDYKRPVLVALAYECSNSGGDKQLEIAKALVRAGARPEAQDSLGQSALHKRAPTITDWFMRALLACSPPANVNIKDNGGWTPLHAHARETIYWQFGAHALIEAKADVNALDNQGNTPLHMAANNASDEVVDVLLGAGADITIKNNRGETPLTISNSWQRKPDWWANKLKEFAAKFQFSFEIQGKETVTAVGASPDGRIWVGTKDRVQVFSDKGEFFAAAAEGQFKSPSGIAFDSGKDQAFIVDGAACCVLVCNLSGTFLRKFGSEGSKDGQFKNPMGIAMYTASSDGVVVSDTGNNRLQLFNTNGVHVRTIGKSLIGGLKNPCGVCVNPSGLIVVADQGHKRLLVCCTHCCGFALRPVLGVWIRHRQAGAS